LIKQPIGGCEKSEGIRRLGIGTAVRIEYTPGKAEHMDSITKE
jgi:hypothetical protein